MFRKSMGFGIFRDKNKMTGDNVNPHLKAVTKQREIPALMSDFELESV